MNTTSSRTTSNKKVQKASDNPESYYAAKTLSYQADRLASRLDGMSETTNLIQMADTGISSVKSYLTQMKGLINNALANSDSTQRRDYGKQFNQLITQVRDVVDDSKYNGINLLYGNTETDVQFSSDYGISKLSVEGVNISAATGEVDASGELASSGVTSNVVVTNTDGTTTSVANSYALTYDNYGTGIIGVKSAGTNGDGWEIDWGSSNYATTLSDLEASIEKMTESLTSQSSVFGADLGVIAMREDFTNTQTTILNTGSDDLVLCDLNEESARMLALKNYQYFAIQCLSLSSTSAQQALSVIM
jgi:flagellin-like hook-associated protein FlgL